MSIEELKKTITALRQEIQNLDESDEETDQQLTDLADLLEQRLENQPGSAETESDNAILSLLENVETQHPRITAIANDLMTRLMGMGI